MPFDVWFRLACFIFVLLWFCFGLVVALLRFCFAMAMVLFFFLFCPLLVWLLFWFDFVCWRNKTEPPQRLKYNNKSKLTVEKLGR